MVDQRGRNEREAIVRTGWRLGVIVGLALIAAPASAQFLAPFGGPGMLAAPEAASGAIGAGAANSAATQQQCTQTFNGREGPRTARRGWRAGHALDPPVRGAGLSVSGRGGLCDSGAP